MKQRSLSRDQAEALVNNAWRAFTRAFPGETITATAPFTIYGEYSLRFERNFLIGKAGDQSPGEFSIGVELEDGFATDMFCSYEKDGDRKMVIFNDTDFSKPGLVLQGQELEVGFGFRI